MLGYREPRVRRAVERQARSDVSPKERRARLNKKNGDLLPKIEPLPGVLLANPVRCGKPTCRSARGTLHGPYLYRRKRDGHRLGHHRTAEFRYEARTRGTRRHRRRGRGIDDGLSAGRRSTAAPAEPRPGAV